GRLFATTLATDPEVLRLVREADQWLRQGATMDGADVQPIREQLIQQLMPAWQALQSHRALQLHVYLGGAGIALLRMQNPEDFGDAIADYRPLLYKALHHGQMTSGLDIGRHSVGNRAIAPLRAGDSPDSPVIGALEVGFGILPELSELGGQLDAGLGILVNQAELEGIFWTRPVGVRLDSLQGWLLQAHSTPQILHWATQRALLAPGSGHTLQVLEAEGRSRRPELSPYPDPCAGRAHAEPFLTPANGRCFGLAGDHSSRGRAPAHRTATIDEMGAGLAGRRSTAADSRLAAASTRHRPAPARHCPAR